MCNVNGPLWSSLFAQFARPAAQPEARLRFRKSIAEFEIWRDVTIFVTISGCVMALVMQRYAILRSQRNRFGKLFDYALTDNYRSLIETRTPHAGLAQYRCQPGRKRYKGTNKLQPEYH